MTILITGATGFVGRAVLDSLDPHIRVRAALWKQEEAALVPPRVQTCVVGCIGEDTDWHAALEGVSVVVHMAARAHITKEKARDPLAEFRRTNATATTALAKQAAAHHVRRFIFVSTIKVNGDSTSPNHPFVEEDSPNPKDPYALSKWEAEQELWRLRQSNTMELVVVRAPLMYGPEVKANFLSLLKAINRGVPLPTARATNRRSLLYVGNFADFLKSCIDHPKAADQTFVVSDGCDVSTTELIHKIAQALERRSCQVPVPVALVKAAATLLHREGAFERLFGNLTLSATKATNLLGWHPPFSIDEGLRITADWFRRGASK